MKRSLGEMTHDWFGSSRNQSKNGSEMTVFERQQTQMKLRQQQHISSSNETQYHGQAQKIQGSTQTQHLTTEDTGLHKTIMMLDHCLGWSEYGQISMPSEMLHSSFECGNKYRLETKTSSLTAANSTGVLRNKFIMEKDCDNSVMDGTPKSDLEFTNEILSKRKMVQFTQAEVCQIRLTGRNRKETSGDMSKGNSQFSELAKPDYIQVRARRGQATDRHSLAERVRREKISQKMRFLQDLVPGCNKITGKTGMLDEIINYVQALQSQVEFLSMKLATVTTTMNFNNGNTHLSEVLTEKTPKYVRVTIPDACSTNIPSIQTRTQTISETILHASRTGELRTTNTPAWAHGNFQGTACFEPIPTWDTDFHALPGSEFHQRKYTSFSSQLTEGDSTSMSENFTMF